MMLWALVLLSILVFAILFPEQMMNSSSLQLGYSPEALAFLDIEQEVLYRDFQRDAAATALRVGPLLIPFFLLGAWAYLDAEARGKPKILVPIIVVFSFPIGLLIWLVGRPDIIRPTND